MKIRFLFLLFIIQTAFVIGQDKVLNQYEYVIVSGKFSFVKQVDGYQTSSFTKFLFNKAGFKTYLDNEEIPQELALNKCKALFANVKDDSGMLTTKSIIELTDCRGEMIYVSNTGTSRLKDYKKAYRQSIRQAFSSIEKMGYTFDASKAKDLTDHKKAVKVTTVAKEVKKPIMVTQKVTVNKKQNLEFPLLFAQKNNAGFQLKNKNTDVVFVLLKTNDPKKFIIKDKNGTLVDKGSFWIAEYYKEGSLVVEKYLIKF